MRRLAVRVTVIAFAVPLLAASPASADSIKKECAASGGTYVKEGHGGARYCQEFSEYIELRDGNETVCVHIYRIWGRSGRHEFDFLTQLDFTPGECPAA